MQLNEDYDTVVDIASRLRILESRYNLMRERIFVVNQNMIDSYKGIRQEVKTIDLEIKEIKKKIFEVEETMKDLLKELRYFARKEEVKVLEKYINMWNPLNFVTEEEVLKIIEEKKGGKHKHSNR